MWLQQHLPLVAYDPAWHQEYEQTRSSILMACEGRVVDVVHIGATAIAGMSAQPIIDVVAVLNEATDRSEALLCIEGLDFAHLGEPFDAVDLLVKPRGDGPKTHQVFLAETDATFLEQAVRFRDRLRNHAELRRNYTELRTMLRERLARDASAYTRGKAQFVLDHLEPGPRGQR